MENREVPRNPEVPVLSEKLVQLLTELCFRKDDFAESVDLIFVFGSSLDFTSLGNITKRLLDKGVSNKVFVSGGGSTYKDTVRFVDKPESSYILDEINPSQYPDVQFYSEVNSRNTLENVTEALKILDFSNYKNILYICKSHDCKRCYLTLRRFLPNAKILQQTFSGLYPNTDRVLAPDNWWTFDFGKTRVWGEFLRIKTYGERGDIAYDEDVRKLVDEIEKQYSL